MARTESKQEEITEEDIEDMAEESGIDKDIIIDSVETKRADELYQDYENCEEENEQNKSALDTISNFVTFVGKSAFRVTNVQKKGNVKKVETDEDEDKIVLVVEQEYPILPYEERESNMIQKEFEFDLESEKDDLDFLIKKAGVSKPSELKGSDIPTIPTDGEEKTNGMIEYKFDVPNKPKTILQKLGYNISRTVLYFNGVERFSKIYDKSLDGEMFVNKNATLLFSAIFLIFGVIIDLIIPTTLGYLGSMLFLSMAGMLFVTYGVMLMYNLFKGLVEFLSKEPEDRDYIKTVIEK